MGTRFRPYDPDRLRILWSGSPKVTSRTLRSDLVDAVDLSAFHVPYHWSAIESSTAIPVPAIPGFAKGR